MQNNILNRGNSLFPVLLLILTFMFAIPGQAQQNQVTKIKYQSVINGKISEGPGVTVLFSDNVAFLSDSKNKIRDFIDYNRKQTVTILSDENGSYKTHTPFDQLAQPVAGEKKDTILNYTCQYAVVTSFSNKIELWYTDRAGVKGSPYLGYLPGENSLVLRVTINGNRTLEAVSVEKTNDGQVPDYPFDKATEVTAAEMEELKIKSRYTRVPVFENQTVNFEPDLVLPTGSELKTGEVYRFSKGSVVMKKIKMPKSWEKGGQVFAQLTCWSEGDAYDRTGSVFIIHETHKTTMLNALQKGVEILPLFTDKTGQNYQGFAATETFEPPIEIMRFFTSFGARYFNTRRVINNYNWKDAAFYNQEITPLIPSDATELWVGVFIGNYDKGGHKVNLQLNFYPSFEEEKPMQNWINPLFHTVNIMEMSGQNYGRFFKTDTLKVAFSVPDSISDLQLLYTTTGHGGWGTGDEFVPKMNRILIDGKQVFEVVPWRTDCATYRLVNPASGNFATGLSSSDLSRSNWCPGTLTPPYFIPLRNLEPGNHRIEVIIDQGADEGGSFSHWSVSGILTGIRM